MLREGVEPLDVIWIVRAVLTTEDILEKALHTVPDPAVRGKLPFGDGKASQKIAEALKKETE